MAKNKLKRFDGLGPYEVKKIRAAVRRVWEYSLARGTVKKRCLDQEGFSKCEKCKKRTPSLKVDHIVACGDVDAGFIERMFVPSAKLMGLCKRCHDSKTKGERAMKKKKFVDSY